MSNEQIAPCRGLVGRVFGHRFEPRFDTKKMQSPDILAQLKASLERAVNDTTIILDGVTSGLTDLVEAAASNEEIHTHDICVRCGAVAVRRSVTVAQPVAAQQQKVVVVPVGANQMAGVHRTVAVPQPNPVTAHPHPPKIKPRP